MELSLLDLVPVRVGQTTSDAFAASHELVRRADELGYTRYWVAEHHNMPSIASTMPGAELMYLGQGTENIRLGSGGVMPRQPCASRRRRALRPPLRDLR